MEIVIKWKYFLFIMLFYTTSIKQCSVVLNDYFKTNNNNNNNNENKIYYKNIIFSDNYSLNKTKIIHTENKTDCNYKRFDNTPNNIALLSSCYLTISPMYDITSIKYFLVQKAKKVGKKTNFFYRYLNFKLIKLTELIDDINLKLQELKFIKMNYNNQTSLASNSLKNTIFTSKATTTTTTALSSQPNHYYESVYFNIINKTITRMIIDDTNLNKYKYFSNSISPIRVLASSDSFNLYDFELDINYWNNYYYEAFNKSLRFDDDVDENLVLLNEHKKLNDKTVDQSSYDEKISFNYETDHVLDLNLNLNSIYNCTLLNYAIIYDKQTSVLYLNVQTNEFKSLKFKLSNYKRDLWFKTNDLVPFKTKLKGVKYDVIKYGIFANFSLKCNISENSTMMSYIHEYDCEVRQENSLLNRLEIRGRYIENLVEKQ
jgi:hypothetical protein